MRTSYTHKRLTRDTLSRTWPYIAVGVLVAIGLFAALQIAGAQVSPAVHDPETTPAPVVLEGDSTGEILLRGTVQDVSQDELEIISWGGTWTIRATDETSVAAGENDAASAEQNADMHAGISVGDFVGVEGTVATDATFTVDAAFVRNWTTDPLIGFFPEREASETGSMAAEAEAVSETESDASAVAVSDVESDTTAEITYSGSVDATTETSFTFTDDWDSTYTVHAATGMAIVDNDNNMIDIADIETGDTVEVDGVAAGEVLHASIVRVTSESGGFLF